MISSAAMTCPIRRHISQDVRGLGLRESANLNLNEDGCEDNPYEVSGAQRPNEQQRAHRVEGTRLDERGDNGLAQSTNSSYPQCSPGVSGVQNEPDDDREGKEDVERK